MKDTSAKPNRKRCPSTEVFNRYKQRIEPLLKQLSSMTSGSHSIEMTDTSNMLFEIQNSLDRATEYLRFDLGLDCDKSEEPK